VESGRLIRVSGYAGGLGGGVYVVAETGPKEALQRVKAKFDSNCDFEDLGTVAGSLIIALNLQQGELREI